MSHKLLVLLLLTLVLAGCSSCPCKKKECPMMKAAAPVAAEAAPVAAPVVEEAAPVVQEPVEKKIPAAVLK